MGEPSWLQFQLVVKRLIDILVSGVALALGWPILLAIGILVRFDSLGPAVFRQLRTGRNGKPFTLLKFRTMYVGVPHLRNPDGTAFVGRDDPRVTWLGRWLREFSLDELPQLVNVFRGNMSLIGPRPERMDYTQELPDWAREKLRFRPGCLSLPLVKGRNELSWQARNEWDVAYVRGYSLWLDAQILFRGLWAMFVSRRGLYSSGKVLDETKLSQWATQGEPK